MIENIRAPFEIFHRFGRVLDQKTYILVTFIGDHVYMNKVFIKL